MTASMSCLQENAKCRACFQSLVLTTLDSSQHFFPDFVSHIYMYMYIIHMPLLLFIGEIFAEDRVKGMIIPFSALVSASVLQSHLTKKYIEGAISHAVRRGFLERELRQATEVALSNSGYMPYIPTRALHLPLILTDDSSKSVTNGSPRLRP